MSSIQEPSRTPPAVEISQKYMSWHLKEINESLKEVVNCFKSIETILKNIIAKKNQQASRPVSNQNEEIPF